MDLGSDRRRAGAAGGCLGDRQAIETTPGKWLDAAILDTFQRRVRAWWILFATLAAAFLLGHVVTVMLFGLISFWALREFITITPTRPGDHLPLFWVFVPLSAVAVCAGGLAGMACTAS